MQGVGPFAREISPDMSEVGDVIQLGRNEDGFYHTLLIVGFDGDDPLVAAQTDNAYRRPLSSYSYDYSRFLKIEGIRIDVADPYDCYNDVLTGVSLRPAMQQGTSSATEPNSESEEAGQNS